MTILIAAIAIILVSMWGLVLTLHLLNRRNRMKRFVWSFGKWEGFHLYEDWYDGPYWYLSIGWLMILWSRDGLPYIFQDREK